MQSFRYIENCKAVSQRRQEQSSATLYTKMLISWSSGFRIPIFLYQIKGKEVSVIVEFGDSELEIRRKPYGSIRKKP